jgi:hypothetical protein
MRSRKFSKKIGGGSTPIPKGLNHSALGCEARATQGPGEEISTTLKGLNARSPLFTGGDPEDELLSSPRRRAEIWDSPGLNLK